MSSLTLIRYCYYLPTSPFYLHYVYLVNGTAKATIA